MEALSVAQVEIGKTYLWKFFDHLNHPIWENEVGVLKICKIGAVVTIISSTSHCRWIAPSAVGQICTIGSGLWYPVEATAEIKLAELMVTLP
jgi:hypothetical protein